MKQQLLQHSSSCKIATEQQTGFPVRSALSGGISRARPALAQRGERARRAQLGWRCSLHSWGPGAPGSPKPPLASCRAALKTEVLSNSSHPDSGGRRNPKQCRPNQTKIPHPFVPPSKLLSTPPFPIALGILLRSKAALFSL